MGDGEGHKPIDIDDYPIDVQVKMLRQLLEDATGDMQTLYGIFETFFFTDDFDAGLQHLVLDGLAITGEYVNADTDAAPTDNGGR